MSATSNAVLAPPSVVSDLSSTSVPYVDIAGENARLKSRILEAVERVLDHGGFVLGREVEEFEARFAEYCGTRFAIGVSNGTAAITLALRAIGIEEGDEVITAPNSFLASVSAIVNAGATPVLVDVDETMNLDPERVEEAITDRTRAILPVHLTGRPAQMEALREIAERHDIHIVEDAAQAVGAEVGGRRAGSIGRLGAFSLHPLKNLSAVGDGGVITTDDAALADWLRKARNHGLENRDECAFWSTNDRLDAMQAAILCEKIAHLDELTAVRRENANVYRARLGGLPHVRVPDPARDEYSVYHTFVIQAQRRDDLQEFLAERGIETKIHYPVPIHLQPAATSLGYCPGSFPVCEGQCRTILSLPVHIGLVSEQLEFVTESIRDFYAEI